jgi:hypothetical protein
VTEDATPLPTVAVVVPTAGRRPEALLRSLEAVLDDPATTEVVVAADVGPDEPLPEVPRDARVRAVRVPAASQGLDERGERAREWAISCVTSEVVLALDDDVVAEPGLVTRHASRHQSGGLVVVGYMPTAHSNLAPRWRLAARYYSRSYEEACSRFESCPGGILEALWGGNFSVRRSDWLAAREAGARFGGYHGDLALGLRLARAGLVGTFDRSLRGEHQYRRTLKGLSADREASAAARVRLHAAYPDEVTAPGAHPRRPAARLVLDLATFVASTRGGWRALRQLLVIAAYAAEAVRLRLVADLLVRLLCRTAFERSLRRIAGR